MKQKVVQMTASGGCIIVMTDMGRIYERVIKISKDSDKYEYTWVELPSPPIPDLTEEIVEHEL